MDQPKVQPAFRYNPLLPYWAVLQMDAWQTLHSWLFRVCLLAAVLAGFGYLLHRVAIHYQAGILQSAALFMTQMLQFSLLVGSSLVVFLTAGTISGERGQMADSVLSRGISRYEYFLAKWHSRVLSTVGSFLAVAAALMLASCFLLQFDLSVPGCLIGLLVVAAVLAVVASLGVTASALCNSTVLAVASVWMLLYGTGLGLALLGFGQLNPLRLYRLIPLLIQGQYHLAAQMELIGWCLLACVGIAVAGLVPFGRRDV